MVMDTKEMPLYIFDIPRALDKKQQKQFYAGIESIKDGYAYDDRYKFREKWFDSPIVWVFTNVLPDMNYLSSDRWKIWLFNTSRTIKLVEKPKQELADAIAQREDEVELSD